ncbi:hypothetical protein Tco_1321377 [Tanacetum coccineum]
MTEIGVDRVTHLVVSDDTTELVREDYPDLVSADVSLEVMQRGLDVVMQDLYDHMSAAMSERVGTLEWDNMRLRGMLDVERQRVECLRRSINMSTATHSRMTQDAINKLIAKRVEEALKAYDAARNPRTETRMEDDNKMTMSRPMLIMETCQPLNFKGTEGVVGLTRWFEKIETVFHISNFPPRYQVKYASCTMLDGALTWWNSHKRTVGVDAAYAMTWKALMKLMTERFQELTLLCTKMVLEEEDQVEKYIGGLPDNIQGNVIATEPTRLQDAVRIANNMMDQKLKGYAIKNAENKRRFDNNSKYNRG